MSDGFSPSANRMIDFEIAERTRDSLKKANKKINVMREALEKIAKSGQDPFSRKWARDALTAIKGEPI